MDTFPSRLGSIKVLTALLKGFPQAERALPYVLGLMCCLAVAMLDLSKIPVTNPPLL